MGVNVPNFGPGTEPGVLRRWAQTVEGLGFDLLMVSDHIAVTPDVAEQYPAPTPSCSIRSAAIRGETHRPETAWPALATVTAAARHVGE